MDQVIYTRYSDERDPAYAVYTQMLQRYPEGKIVRKVAETAAGRGHLRHIWEAGEALAGLYGTPGSRLGVDPCRLCGESLELTYLEGPTLEEQLDRELREKGSEAVLRMLRGYIAEAVPSDRLQPFRMTEEFREWFGDQTFPEGTLSLPVSDIDLICSNVVCTAEKRMLIDYEWTFSFPVPADFLIFRILYYYTAFGTGRQALNHDGIYGEYGITPAHIRIYQEMEYTFQKKVQGSSVPLRSLYDAISPGYRDVRDGAETQAASSPQEFLDVFFFSADGTVTGPDRYPFRSNRIDLEFSVPETAATVRLDPGDYPCLCRLQLLALDGKPAGQSFCETNGVWMDRDAVIFSAADPQIWFPTGGRRIRNISVSMEICRIPDEFAGSLGHFARGNTKERRKPFLFGRKRNGSGKGSEA